MDNQKYIPVEQICIHYEVPKSFLMNLKEYGLITMLVIKEEECIEMNEINKIEKIMRLHFDLNINMEGIDSVLHLLDKVNALQAQITALNNKITFHEDESKLS
jgi:hypothetical protein